MKNIWRSMLIMLIFSFLFSGVVGYECSCKSNTQQKSPYMIYFVDSETGCKFTLKYEIEDRPDGSIDGYCVCKDSPDTPFATYSLNSNKNSLTYIIGMDDGPWGWGWEYINNYFTPNDFVTEIKIEKKSKNKLNLNFKVLREDSTHSLSVNFHLTSSTCKLKLLDDLGNEEGEYDKGRWIVKELFYSNDIATKNIARQSKSYSIEIVKEEEGGGGETCKDGEILIEDITVDNCNITAKIKHCNKYDKSDLAFSWDIKDSNGKVLSKTSYGTYGFFGGCGCEETNNKCCEKTEKLGSIREYCTDKNRKIDVEARIYESGSKIAEKKTTIDCSKYYDTCVGGGGEETKKCDEIEGCSCVDKASWCGEGYEIKSEYSCNFGVCCCRKPETKKPNFKVTGVKYENYEKSEKDLIINVDVEGSNLEDIKNKYVDITITPTIDGKKDYGRSSFKKVSDLENGITVKDILYNALSSCKKKISIEACIDTYNKFDESNENDNCKSIEIECGGEETKCDETKLPDFKVSAWPEKSGENSYKIKFKIDNDGGCKGIDNSDWLEVKLYKKGISNPVKTEYIFDLLNMPYESEFKNTLFDCKDNTISLLTVNITPKGFSDSNENNNGAVISKEDINKICKKEGGGGGGGEETKCKNECDKEGTFCEGNKIMKCVKENDGCLKKKIVETCKNNEVCKNVNSKSKCVSKEDLSDSIRVSLTSETKIPGELTKNEESPITLGWKVDKASEEIVSAVCIYSSDNTNKETGIKIENDDGTWTDISEKWCVEYPAKQGDKVVETFKIKCEREGSYSIEVGAGYKKEKSSKNVKITGGMSSQITCKAEENKPNIKMDRMNFKISNKNVTIEYIITVENSDKLNNKNIDVNLEIGNKRDSQAISLESCTKESNTKLTCRGSFENIKISEICENEKIKVTLKASANIDESNKADNEISRTLTCSPTSGGGYEIEKMKFETFAASDVRQVYVPFAISLKKGWNMISIPGNEEIDVSSLLSSCKPYKNLTFYYSPEKRKWETSNKIMPNRGGFIYAYNPCIVPTYIKREKTSLNLTKGWNLVAGNGMKVKDIIDSCGSGSIYKYVFYFDPEKYRKYRKGWIKLTGEDVLEEGKAYWIYAYKKCIAG